MPEARISRAVFRLGNGMDGIYWLGLCTVRVDRMAFSFPRVPRLKIHQRPKISAFEYKSAHGQTLICVKCTERSDTCPVRHALDSEIDVDSPAYGAFIIRSEKPT